MRSNDVDPVWKFLDTGANTGACNMRFDEQLARDLQAGSGQPVFRLFQWKPWALSLGFNQDIAEISEEKCRTFGFDVVRRPTGGRAILHAEELTYSVVMNTENRSVLEVYNQISRALVRGLKLFGVDVELQKSQPNFAQSYKQPTSVPCFTASARYEIEWKGRKLVGSAQRRFHAGSSEVVLQHGSILTGPAHRKLIDCLSVTDGMALNVIRKEMQEKTTDLAEIMNAPVDIGKLAQCMRRGFEVEWGIEFRSRDNHPVAPSLRSDEKAGRAVLSDSSGTSD